MKKVLKKILLFCMTVMIMPISICANSIEHKYVYNNGRTDIYVTENKEGRVGVNVRETYHNGAHIVCETNDIAGTISLKIYIDDVVVHEKTILNPYFYTEAHVNDVGIHQTRSPESEEESWFGYAYYLNRSSAYEDVYWRLYNPNPEISPSSKYFFASYGSEEQENADDFADCVIIMKGLENTLDAVLTLYDIEIITSTIDIATSVLLMEKDILEETIETLDLVAQMTSTEVGMTAEIYNQAILADSCYIDIKK